MVDAKSTPKQNSFDYGMLVKVIAARSWKAARGLIDERVVEYVLRKMRW